MFKQIIVAMAGAIAAQITAATLDFSPSGRLAVGRRDGCPAGLLRDARYGRNDRALSRRTVSGDHPLM
jgi:hypothetical protein